MPSTKAEGPRAELSVEYGYPGIQTLDLGSFGRNGRSKQGGLSLSAYDRRKVCLTPINSKGDLTHGCELQIPWDSVDAVVDALRELQEYHKRELLSQ